MRKVRIYRSREPDAEDADKGEMPRKKHRKRSPRLDILLGVILALGCAALVIVYGCRTETVTVTGNTLYSESEIADMLKSQPRCDNSFWFWFYYNYRYKNQIPLLKSVSVKMKSLTSLSVTVNEKKIVGYINFDGIRVFFDGEGEAVSKANAPFDGIPEVTGFDIEQPALGETLPISDTSLLSQLLETAQAVSKAGISVSRIDFDSKGAITLTSGTIEIDMGFGERIDEKVNLAATLLPKLTGKSGTLHLEDYDGSNGSRSFVESP